MTNKKTTTEEPASKQSNHNNIIIGVGLLLAVLSIAYSTTVIVMGTDGWIPKALLVPQVALAGWIAIKQFIKQGE